MFISISFSIQVNEAAQEGALVVKRALVKLLYSFLTKTRLISIESQPKKIVVVVVVANGVVVVVVHVIVVVIFVVDPRNLPLI